ncbi:MAG TPA: hypothetical protein VFI47_16965 [Acidimicrobiales bacterium]|nr:hypothetical protein [Acidimicrobiales bacterium]
MVDAELRSRVAKHNPAELVGLSCIADGPDALFAQAVLDHGGELEVFVPADEYRAGLPAEHHSTYDRLLAAASTVHRLPYRESTSESHMAASELMLDGADELYAVWDGLPARGYGGTADVVTAAHRLGLPVAIIWPNGATRD